MSDPPARLAVDGVTKAFPGVVANRDVSFAVRPGAIHALLGENGAGKSTLVKIVYGVMRPDAGAMAIDGEAYAPARPAEARARGVGMVFQHFSLFEAMSVLENVALGLPRAEAGRDLADRIVEVSRAYGLEIDPKRTVGALSVGERQRVEIVRCLLQSPRLLIMDEPTSVLTPKEAARLFETLNALSDEGRSILYISHKLEEIRANCVAATVLRGGEVVGDCDPREASARDLAEMMIGQKLALPRISKTQFGEQKLSVAKLSTTRRTPFGVDLKDVSFAVRAGEILGVAGVAGNGQMELLEALTGEQPTPRDAVQLNGRPIGHLGPTARRKLGLCGVPEERLGHGAAPEMSLWENTLLSARTRRRMTSRGFLKLGAARTYAEAVVRTFDVRTSGVEPSAATLSGGNLQKFLVGREILQAPDVLVILQPTWGVDAAAAAAIRAALQELAEGGAAVLVISQDLDELFEISTTLAVIANGRLTAPRPTADMTVEAIALAMGDAEAEAHA